VLQDATRGVRSAAQDFKDTAVETVKVHSVLLSPGDF